MTNRLYYDDSYLTEFDGVVEEVRGSDVRLDRSAFYPTSGGQPYDTGTLGGFAIEDVYVDDKLDVWHKISGELHVGDTVHGVIDWARRFDHMQQHAGEHMLANACYRLLHGNTIGLHLGHEDSSIDVELPDGTTRISKEMLDALEDDVNARIQRDVPIHCWFPSAEELAALPLRKAPTVQTHIRVVQIGEEEFVACGGTHPNTAGQIGLVKIVDARPSKGKLRLTFVCGARAFRAYRQCYDISGTAAEMLSTGRENLVTAAKRLQERLYEAEHALLQAKRTILFSRIPELLDSAECVHGIQIVAAQVEADMPLLRELAEELTKRENTIALLSAAASDDMLYCFARSANIAVHMGKLLSESAKQVGGKGGGRPEMAQGGGKMGMIAAAKAILPHIIL